MSLRVASLDYLGTVAARLRKDAVTSQLNEESIQEIIKQVCFNCCLIFLSCLTKLSLFRATQNRWL